jgi:hypothetical protein
MINNLKNNRMVKAWYKSKTILSAMGFIALALFHYHKTSDITKTIELILLGTGLLGIRTAYKKIG